MPKKLESSYDDQYFNTDHLTGSIGARTSRGGLVAMGFHGGKFAVNIASTMILARLLTPGDYGLIGMVAVITNFASLFKDMGLGTATIQKTNISHNQVSALFWVNAALSFTIMVLVMAISPVVAWFYDEPRLTLVTFITAMGFMIEGIAVQHEALLNRQMRFFAMNGITFLSMTFGYVAGISLAWYGLHYWALVFAQLTVLATRTTGVWLACRWRPGRPQKSAEVKSMLAVGGGVTGYSTINYLSRNTDSLLIGHFLGAQHVGVYSKATQLLALPTDQINEPLGSVTIPALSLLTNEPERYRKAYMRIMEKALMLIMPIVAVMVVTADWMVYLMLGPQWHESVPIFFCLGFSGLLLPITNTVGWLLATQSRSKDLVKWSMFINAPVSILSIIVGLQWGVIGVAAIYSFARFFIINPLTYWFVGRNGPMRTKDFYRLITPYLLASSLGMIACYFYRDYASISNPVIGIASNTILLCSVNMLVLCVLPRGRSAIIDLQKLFLNLRPTKQN